MKGLRAALCLIISLTLVVMAAGIPAGNSTAGFLAPFGVNTEVGKADPCEDAAIPVPEETTVSSAVSRSAQEEKTAMFTEEAPVPAVVGANAEETGEEPETVRTDLYDGVTEVTNMLAFGREYLGSFYSAEETHVYTFTVTERGYIRYTAEHGEIPNFGGWAFTLWQEYSPDGTGAATAFREINMLKTTTAAGADASPEIGLLPGEYRITAKVSGSNYTSESYRFTAEFTPATDHEIECNDNIYRYTEIYSGVPMHGSASYLDGRKDTDCFMFRMPKDGFVRLSFTHPDKNGVAVCWRVVLYTMQGEEIYSENSSLGTVSLDSGEIGLKAGWYFIGVYNRVYTDCGYVLTLTRQNTSAYESERNDTQQTADPIDLNRVTCGALTSQNGKHDTDWYRFDITAGGYFSLAFTHPAFLPENDSDEKKDGWNVSLLTAEGEGIYRVVSAWSSEGEESPFIGLGVGTYYIRVDNAALFGNNATYTLKPVFTAAENWESEPNGSPGTADEIVPGVPVSASVTVYGTAFDTDHFAFTKEKEGAAQIVLSHPSDVSERELYVVSLLDETGGAMPLSDAEGQPLTGENGEALTETRVSGGEVITKAFYASLPAGRYVVRVSSGLYFDSMPYTLTVIEP